MESLAPYPITAQAQDYFLGKKILVTGACGTVGREMVAQLLHLQPAHLIGIDHNESELVFLGEEHARHTQVEFLLCDIRDRDALLRHMRGVDIVFHAAAYKHVAVCERSPLEAIQTNVLGVQNVIQAAIENHVERLVFTSSDKAVNPTNVMGTSKLMGERLITAAAIDPHLDGSVFLSTRFGNVLGSRGSVIPIFHDQIRNGGPVTLTDLRMTRFIMSLEQAIRLVIESTVLARPGDVLVTKMPAIRIADLAQILIQECASMFGHRPEQIATVVIGQKPGEKLHEELMNEEETRRSLELADHFLIRPASAVPGSINPDYPGIISESVERPYNSVNQPALSLQELAAFLRKNDLLDPLPGRRSAM